MLEIHPETDLLLVVDVQNDFCEGGRLAVPGGSEIVATVGRLMDAFPHVVLTQDWHPPGHLSFASSHPGRQPFEQIEVAYGPQTLWPDHCVQDTAGAAFHPGLDTAKADLVLRKGADPALDSYSAFVENDRRTPTGLTGYLREKGVERVFLAGLAFDYCVAWSAEDARREGFAAVVIEDACRAIDLAGSAAAARDRLSAAGVRLIRAAALV
ncbi:bifunctional nicotinamidase/pyrazinamidase [Zavarzinia sp.]|uniref:bifunctional nicotinamidase/pyrazinamidase n=1 Tax=Zavarzinia sp. TaxID=2027920 RepID=UPI0035646116